MEEDDGVENGNGPEREEEPPPTGKLRTFWHPLAIRILRGELRGFYKVEDEILVGQSPFQIDASLLRLIVDQPLPESVQEDLKSLVPLFNQYTLVEFKGPTDSLEVSDLAHFIGTTFLWHSQQERLIPHHELSLILLIPKLNKPGRRSLDALGYKTAQVIPGVHQIEGPTFKTWVVEIEVRAEHGEAILSLISSRILKEPASVKDILMSRGRENLICYVLQYIREFKKMPPELRIQYTALDTAAEEALDEVVSKFLEDLPAEKRLEGLSAEKRLEGLSAEKRLEGLPAEKRLEGLSAEEVVKGISEEELEELRKLINESEEE